jgi:hypothetical protein
MFLGVSDQHYDGVMVEMDNAEVGARYRVSWDDCCAQGSFESGVTARNERPDTAGGGTYLESLTFANGVTVSGHGVILEPVPGASSPA